MNNRNLSTLVWLCLGLLVPSTFLAEDCVAAEESDTASVRKYDPANASFVPVRTAEIKPGKIYSHFSPRHDRYVWAYAKPGGGFSHALGTGSTELPSNFDLAGSRRETEDLVAEAAGDWLERSRREGSKVFVRLGADDKWTIVRGRSVRSHYDLDSGLRWEWHGNRRVSVMHTHGYVWSVSGDRYLPAIPWHLSQLWYDGACTCPHCSSTNPR